MTAFGALFSPHKGLAFSRLHMSSSAASSESSIFRVAVCQMCSKGDTEANYQTIARLSAQAKEGGAKLACFPENFNFLGTERKQSFAIAEDLTGPAIARYKELATSLDIWLSLGGFQERAPDVDNAPRIKNTHVVISAAGELVASYSKLHLFDAPYVNLMESTFTTAGDQVVVLDSPVGRLGLSVCYDVRFPELYAALRKLGAEVILIPAAFTVPTGCAHWEVLMRARAIETQSYILAAAQCGSHNEKRASYGHSMIVDPWGVIIAQASDGEGVCVADIDLSFLKDVRKRMPVIDHARPSVYERVEDMKAGTPKL